MCIKKQARHRKLQLGINSHAFIADTSQQAADEFYPPYAAVMTQIGRERGWPPTKPGAIRPIP
jgi:hypothetical protein